MVLKPEPMFGALEAIARTGRAATVILTSPQGTRFTQEVAQRLSRRPRWRFCAADTKGWTIACEPGWTRRSRSATTS
jgi:tRNA G37 N-methylase TrmD